MRGWPRRRRDNRFNPTYGTQRMAGARHKNAMWKEIGGQSEIYHRQRAGATRAIRVLLLNFSSFAHYP